MCLIFSVCLLQVRVHVIEGRKLVGGNIKPVVKVICGKDVEETSVQKSTNQPFWDEMVYFNFKVLPKEMLEKVVDIKVCCNELISPVI